MPKSVVVVGAVALGPKAACRFKRLEPYALCHLPDKCRVGIAHRLAGRKK
jgi:hypothetical protein